MNPETSHEIATQAVVIRTIGSPELLTRNLAALHAGITATSSCAEISVGVLDDSQDRASQIANRDTLAESGVNGHYLSTQETDKTGILSRIRERAVNIAAGHGVTSDKVLQAYQYLLTEQYSMDQPTFLPDMQIGRGSDATCNVATLFGAYLLGTTNAPEGSGIITHYDNDVIPGTTITRESGFPAFETFDQFSARDEHFSDPESLLSAGKYAGIAGDPFGTAVIAMQVTESIIESYSTGDHDEISPFALYDASTNEFMQITKAEAFQRLPEIIQSFLARSPITGFLSQEDLKFSSATIKHDGGNFTHRDTIAREIPASPTGVHEYAILAALKALHTDVPIESLIKVEQPAVHLRGVLPADIDIHQGGLLSGAYGRILSHQILLEMALEQEPALVGEILQALGADQIDESAIDHLPKLNTGANMPQSIGYGEPVTKNQRIERVRELRDRVIASSAELPDGFSEIASSIKMLTDEFNEATLTTIEKVLAPSGQNAADIRKMITAIRKYYVPSIKIWPMLYDAAYQVGLEDFFASDAANVHRSPKHYTIVS